MRAFVLLGVLLLPAGLWSQTPAQPAKPAQPAPAAGAADKKAEEPAKPEPPKPVPPKPESRVVQLKDKGLLFNVRLRPGAPDPGQVVEVFIEMNEVPPVPDPVYGEQIPIKDAQITVEVTDADGAGYTTAYRVHPLQDAGSYGMHFTPARKDNYRLTLKGKHTTGRYEVGTRVPVGIWPFANVDEKGRVKEEAPVADSGRLPAVPAGMKGPAQPAATSAAPSVRSPLQAASPMKLAMRALGQAWADGMAAMYAGRKPDLKQAAFLAEPFRALAEKTAGLGSGEFADLMQQTAQAIGDFERAAKAGKEREALEAFERVGVHHCTRCHFKGRWRIIDDVLKFPGALP